MNDREFRDKLGELQAMYLTNRLKVLSNPEPYLDAMSRELVRARVCFDRLQLSLSADIVFEVAGMMDIKPVDFQGEALVRCNEAKRVLEEYWGGGTGGFPKDMEMD